MEWQARGVGESGEVPAALALLYAPTQVLLLLLLLRLLCLFPAGVDLTLNMYVDFNGQKTKNT